MFTTGVFATDESSLLVPSLGASGAISGVLGGYLLLHPKRRVTVILFRFLTDVPAYVAIGIWFAFQLISGLGMLGGGSQQGGVAYAAHIGGFIAGLVLIKFFDTWQSRSRTGLLATKALITYSILCLRVFVVKIASPWPRFYRPTSNVSTFNRRRERR